MADAYDIVNRIRAQSGGGSFPVELGTVVEVNPLTVQIGEAQYNSKFWAFYEPTYMEQDIKLWNLRLKDEKGHEYLYNTECAARTGAIKYHKGDLLAVQQMAGGKSFIILSKLKKVI